MCEWDTAQYLIFSGNGEPLIYYSHLTSILIFAGLLIFTFLRLKPWPKNSFRLMAGAYIVWLFSDVVLWANESIDHVIFFWTLLGMVEPLIFIGAYAYFIQFLEKRPISTANQWLIFIIILPALYFGAAGLSVIGFDYTTCDRNAWEGLGIYYGYVVETILLLLIIWKTIVRLLKEKTRQERVKIFLVSLGTCLLFLSFLAANVVATITGDYVTSQYGHIAVPIFAAFLTYITIKYESFEPRILLIDTLVIALVILIFSLLFAENDNYQIYANLMAFILVLPLGYTLLTGIRKEVRARKQIEKLAKQLEVANERLKELDRMKSEFLSIASHQLRAPITAIKGYASLIVQGDYGPVPNTMKDPLERVSESARVMASSIEDYLNISRIEQGSLKYEFAPVDVASVAQKVVEEMRPVALAKHLALNFSSKDGALMVQADFGKIKQVFSNLVDNAIKYTEKGSVNVSVEKAQDASGKGVARIVVEDTGAGIPREEMGGLFEKFVRARGANKVNTTGTGLGLYVAKQLVEGHKGTVRIESDGLGKGTRFIVELPA